MTEAYSHCPCTAWNHAHRPGECDEPRPSPGSGATVCPTCRLWHETHHPCPTCGAPTVAGDGRITYIRAGR